MHDDPTKSDSGNILRLPTTYRITPESFGLEMDNLPPVKTFVMGKNGERTELQQCQVYPFVPFRPDSLPTKESD